MSNQIVISSGAKVRNLNGVLTGTSGVVGSVPLGAANGVATLDSGGKVPVSQLPSSVVTYLGTWNAATNTPTLTNGVGDAGDMYICNVSGTVNFGAFPITFAVGDWVLYGSGTWQKSNGQNGTVTSVGASITGGAIGITGSPITTAGTLAFAFAGTSGQYVNGAGNLTTFPDLTGFVPYTGATANVNIGTHSFIANNGTYNSEMSPSLFGVENAAGTIFGVLEYNKLTLTNSTGAGSVMEVNAQGLIFPDASVQISSYTDAKARLALSLTTTGTSGVATYNNTTGVFNIPNYGSALSGYVPYTGATTDVDLGTHVLNAQALHVKGTAGAGHLGLKHQTASPTGSANESMIFADVNGDLGWQNGNLYLNKFVTSANTANRSYTFPNASGTVALTSDISYPVTSVFGRTGAVVATSGDYTTTLVTEGTRLYYTDTRARAALSFVAGSGAYNSTTGVITIPTNNTQITNGANYITLTSLSFAAGSGAYNSTTGIITIPTNNTQITNGANYITLGSLSAGVGISYNNTTGVITNSAPDQTVALTASTGISVTGTYPNFTITNTSPSSGGTVTSVAALTIGTSGTDLSSTVATSTTTPVITLNVPTASAANRGALSSADWSTFNSKQGTITLTTTGTSGAATFSSNTLNIPNYGSALSGYLPLSAGVSFPLTGDLYLNFNSASFDFARVYNASSTGGSDFRLGNDANINLGFIRVGGSAIGGIYQNTLTLGTGGGYDINIAPNGSVGLKVANGGNTTLYGALSGTNASFSGIVTSNQYFDINGTSTPATTGGKLSLGYYTAGGYAWMQSWSSTPLILNPYGNNVGIGSSTAAYQLDVTGTFRATGAAIFSSSVSVGTAVNTPGSAFNSIFNVNGANLGGTTGNTAKIANLGFDAGGNHAGLGITAYRQSTGTNWTTAGIKFTYDVDNSTAIYDNMLCFYGGNVGIGTTNPLYKLVVSNGGAEGLEIGTGYLSNKTLIQAYNRSGATYNQMDFAASSFSFNNAATFSSSVTATTTTATGAVMEIQGSVNAVKTLYINRYGVASGSQHRLRAENAYFEIASANSEPIVLTGGNVLIGTTTDSGNGYLQIGNSSANKISLTGGSSQNGMRWESVATANTFYLFNGNYGPGPGWGIYNVTTAELPFWIQNSGAATFSANVSATIFTSTGGRGTSFGFRLPDWQIYNTSSGNGLAFNNYSIDCLTLASNGAATFSSSVQTGGNIISIVNNTNTKLSLQRTGTTPNNFDFEVQDNQSRIRWYNSANDKDLFFDSDLSGTTRMIIKGGGNVLIGTTTDDGVNKLQVNGSIVSTSTIAAVVHSNVDMFVFNNTGATYTKSCVVASMTATGGTGSYFFYGQQSTSTVALKIFSNGNIQNTNNSYGAISDARLKENIIDATPKLADLMKVKVRNYNLKGESNKQLGVISQELEEIFPNMIEESTNLGENVKIKGVKYSVFVPMLIKAVQEQQEQINELKQLLNK